MKKSNKQSKKRDIFLKLPARVLQDRHVAVLEAIVEYLKEEKEMKYSEIAKLLNRDDRTIWTVYSRVRQKRKALGQDTEKNKKTSDKETEQKNKNKNDKTSNKKLEKKIKASNTKVKSNKQITDKEVENNNDKISNNQKRKKKTNNKTSNNKENKIKKRINKLK